jgi:hypothetical protein
MDRGRAEEELKTGILGTRIHFAPLMPQCTGYSAHGHGQPVSEWGCAVAACGRLKDVSTQPLGKSPASGKYPQTWKPDRQAKPALDIFRVPLTIERIIRVVLACRPPRQPPSTLQQRTPQRVPNLLQWMGGSLKVA